MILFAFATETEAQPFIEHLRLKKRNQGELYGLYEEGNSSLVITGMGSMKAALYLSDLVQRKKREGTSITKIINYGIAGCLVDTFSIGEVVEIDRVIKYNPEAWSKPIPDTHFLSAFPDIALNEKTSGVHILATSDHPVFNRKESVRMAEYAHFVDMEGYGYAFAAGYYKIPIKLIKGVSDFVFKHSEESFKKNVKTCLENLLSFHLSHTP